jgi:hypothetical protein
MLVAMLAILKKRKVTIKVWRQTKLISLQLKEMALLKRRRKRKRVLMKAI